MRIIAIWITGSIGAAIVGGLIGDWSCGRKLFCNNDIFGMIGGTLLFVCGRLWLGPRS